MSKINLEKKIADLEKACRCLYIEVAPSIAEDVQEKAKAVINQLKECREECKARQELLMAYRSGSYQKADHALSTLKKLRGGYRGQSLDESYEVSRKAQLKAEELSRGGP